jgi:hypothetical protein
VIVAAVQVLATADALAPIVAGLIVLFAIFGGDFGSLFNKGAMLTFVKLLSFYWLVQAGKAALVHGDCQRRDGSCSPFGPPHIPLTAFAHRHDAGVG